MKLQIKILYYNIGDHSELSKKCMGEKRKYHGI